jgi:hypothetical protein
MIDTVDKLIAARQPHAKFPLRAINATLHPVGNPAQCYQNACAVEEVDEAAQMVSGWLVGKYDPRARITPIIAHWWNRFGSEHLDTTPIGEGNWVHVLDLNLMRYAYKHDDSLQSHIPSSLALTDNGFLLAVVNTHSELDFLPIQQLTDDALFKQCLRCE